MKGGGIATGVILFLIGAMVILRTVVKDDTGNNLVDKILSLGQTGPTVPVNVNPITPGQINQALHPPSVKARGSRKGSTAKPNRAAQAGGY